MTPTHGDKYSQDDCDRRHSWLSGNNIIMGGVITCLFIATGWNTLAANKAAEKAEFVATALAVQQTKVEDNWAAHARQYGQLQAQLADVKAALTKADDNILDELKENRKLVLQLLQERHASTP